MARFLVEGYAPNPGAAGLRALRLAARRAAAQLAGDGTSVSCLSVIYLPDDETCLSVFEAPSADVVREASAMAELPSDRIVRAEVEDGSSDARGET